MIKRIESDLGRFPFFRSPEQKKIKQYKNFIDDGLRMMARGNFGEAVAYFRNSERASLVAQQAGLRYDGINGRSYIIREAITTEEQIENFMYELGQSGAFGFDREPPTIHTSPGIEIAPVGFMGITQQIEITPRIQRLIHQYNAIANAEEWIHGLFFLLEKFPNHTKAIDHQQNELEVTQYMQASGVNLPDSFFLRYPIREQLRPFNPTLPKHVI